jgi:hypothetical protein
LRHTANRRDLTYLCEDLTKGLEKLLDSGELDEYQVEQATQAFEIAKGTNGLDIGAQSRLDSMQYILSEIQLELWEGDATNLKVQHMIDGIQVFIDWTYPKLGA